MALWAAAPRTPHQERGETERREMKREMGGERELGRESERERERWRERYLTKEKIQIQKCSISLNPQGMLLFTKTKVYFFVKFKYLSVKMIYECVPRCVFFL